jgi:hypothetical protein
MGKFKHDATSTSSTPVFLPRNRSSTRFSKSQFRSIQFYPFPSGHNSPAPSSQRPSFSCSTAWTGILEFPTVVGEISKRFQESSFLTFGENAGDEDDNLLLWYSQRLDWVKGWFEAKTAADAPSKAPTTGDEAALNFGDAANGYLLSSDDDFWQEFMREWGGMSSF